MHNDEPTLLDSLDRKALIHEVGDAIATCTPPQVFGVHGDWGMGKTSFLHQVQWYLTGECPQLPDAVAKEAAANDINVGPHRRAICAIWFDAWRYQYEDAPVIALLQEMRAQLSGMTRARNVASVAVRGALLSIEEETKKIGFRYSKFQQANREWKSEHLADPLPSYTIRSFLSEAIDQLLPRKTRDLDTTPRLVIFIDDIDRCEPAAAFRLLEGLKIYLTLDNCVFVLGMNQKAIEEAIGAQIPNEDTRKERATAYMEKLCQNVWRLPAIRQPLRYFQSLLEETVSDPVTRRNTIAGLEGIDCLPPNPRRLKGLANLVGRLSSLLPPSGRLPSEEDAAIRETQLLMIVAYVYQFHHDLYVRWEADLSLYERIYDWSSGRLAEDSDDTNEDLGNLREVFRSMILPKREQADVPGMFDGTYPDPADARVFWIQQLVRKLGGEVDGDKFRRYVHRQENPQ